MIARVMNAAFQKLMGQVFLMVCLFSFSSNTNAQTTVYSLLLSKIGGTAPEPALGMALDSNTNYYILGQFSTNTTIKTTTLTNASGWPGVFLVKSIFAGLVLWSRAPVTDYVMSNAKVGCDSKGSNYIAGNFGGTNLTFGTATLTNYSTDHSDDVFLVKYDPNGNFKWLTQLGGTAEDSLGSMVTDTNGNCYLTGAFQSPTFAAGTSNLLRQSASGSDCFVAKYDGGGNLVWIQQGSYAHGTSLALDSATNCYVGGYVTGPAVFNGLSPSNAMTTNFLAKYSSSGTLLWVRGDLTLGQYIMLDKAQNFYTAGTFSNRVQFGPLTLGNNSASTIFVAKYDSNGNALWARQLPGLGNDGVTSLAMDGYTNCWIGGYYAAVNSPSNTIALVAQLDQSGNLNAVSQMSTSQVSQVSAMSVMINSKGSSVFPCGSYATNFTFGSHSITNSGNMDIFVAWVRAVPPLTATTSGTNLVCYWPTTDTNLTLQASADLSNWSAVSNFVSTVNGQNVVSNAMTGTARFFRLILQQ